MIFRFVRRVALSELVSSWFFFSINLSKFKSRKYAYYSTNHSDGVSIILTDRIYTEMFKKQAQRMHFVTNTRSTRSIRNLHLVRGGGTEKGSTMSSVDLTVKVNVF